LGDGPGFFAALALLVAVLYVVARRSRQTDESVEARSGVVTAAWGGPTTEQLTRDNPPQLLRSYKARTPGDADRLFLEEAPLLAKRGYFPTQQRWNAGQWRGIDFVAAVILMFVLVGFLIFVYMIIVKPDGTLTVTYEPRVSTASASPPPAARAATSIADRLTALEDLRRSGTINDEEYADQRRRILSET
jgi:hypothetical protein